MSKSCKSEIEILADKRTKKAQYNILILGLYKVISVIILFLMVPMAISYLNSFKFGLWVTLTSVVSWCQFFDVGLCNGLKNKLAESLAINKISKAKIYVSTTYFLLSVIVSALLLIFYVSNELIDWSKVLNAPASMRSELKIVAAIVVTSFFLNLIFNTICAVLMAHQEPGYAEKIKCIGQITTLLFVWLVTKGNENSLVLLSVTMTFPTTAILVFYTIKLYRTRFYKIRPSLAKIRLNSVRELVSIGSMFFLIQISYVVTYQTSNILIAHLLEPDKVTEYNIVSRYFSVPMMLFAVILTPFWTAFTDANKRDDKAWMISIYKKLIISYFIVLIGVILMFVLSGVIYKIWISNEEIKISNTLSLIVGLSILINMWNNLHSYILNGLNKIKLQTVLSIIIMLLNIPLAYIMGKSFGINGIVCAPMILCLLFSIFLPIQLTKFLK